MAANHGEGVAKVAGGFRRQVMKTFDEILPKIQETLLTQGKNLEKIGQLIINRDLNGIVRLVIDENFENNGETKKSIDDIVKNLAIHLESRLADKNTVIYESSLADIIESAPHFTLSNIPNVIVTDRLLTESDWTNISPVANTHRIVFYSIKGGVGRSTALAASAWALAEQGKKVMVLDRDLESPGVSGSLLPYEKCPVYGIVDWLVEDLIDNGTAVAPYMVGLSDVSHNGSVYVVPAHGKEAGEYIAKLEAARLFYKSKVYRMLENEKTKFWHFSYMSLCMMYDEEKASGSFAMPEET
jgi:hypothetical protein